jgi:excisionase family DNA binding protein
MNKDQEIKDIETQQQALADRLAKLQEPEPEPKPRAGEVWTSYGAPLLMTNERRPVALLSNDVWDAGSLRSEHLILSERLGTFDEVYMLRSEAPKANEYNTLTTTNNRYTTKTYTKKEVATALKVHPLTITNWIKEGKLEAFKINRVVRVTEEAISAMMKGGKTGG